MGMLQGFSVFIVSKRQPFPSATTDLLPVYRFACSGHFLEMEPYSTVVLW